MDIMRFPHLHFHDIHNFKCIDNKIIQWSSKKKPFHDSIGLWYALWSGRILEPDAIGCVPSYTPASASL